MGGTTKARADSDTGETIPILEDRYSTGVPDFNRLFGGEFKRGSLVTIDLDTAVGREDRTAGRPYIAFIPWLRGMESVR